MATRTITVDDLSAKESLTTRKYNIVFTPQDEKDKLESANALKDLDSDSATALWRWLTEGDSRDLAGILRKRPYRVPGSDGSDNGNDADSEEIRTWAKTQPEFKDTIKDRGRVPEDVREAYVKAHPVTPASDAS